MTDLGPLKYFASVEVQRDMEKGTTFLTQTGYIQDILAKYNLSDCYGRSTPCTTSIYKYQLFDPIKLNTKYIDTRTEHTRHSKCKMH